MREIKFRIWDKKDKKMYGVINLTPPKEKNYSSKIWIEVNNNTILQQFTGIKDKNGKEIYEGDIVTQHHLKAECFGEINYEIIYYQEECCFEMATLSDYTKERYLTPLRKGIELEVIGNIYENLDLINQ
jgi:uncharacterized phage protein (TIGR01671 family)